jgi:hypothetical protein
LNRLIVLLCIFLLFLLFSMRSFNPETLTMTRDDFQGVLSVFPIRNNQVVNKSQVTTGKEDVYHVSVLIPCE